MIDLQPVFANAGVYLENVGQFLNPTIRFYPGHQKARHFFILEVYIIVVEEF